MNWKSIKGYVVVVFSGVFLAAAALLVLSNLGNRSDLTFFWTILRRQSIGAVMLISAGAGVLAVFMFRLGLWGIRQLRTGRNESRLRKLEQAEMARGSEQPR